MSVTRTNVEATKTFIRARLGNPYVYGGALSTNVRQGTDCSEVWQTVLEMAFGRWKPGRQSEGATTESYRPRSMGGPIPDGGVGPFGTINVSHWSKIPANAAAKICFHHGPGGGANSHMWGELDGMLIESGGSKGLVTNGRALTVGSTYANAWAYLPGPIDGVAGPPPPLGMGSVGQEVVALQQRLNAEGAGLEVDGDYGPATAAAVAAWDRRTRYALAVIQEGRKRNISRKGICIALSVPFVESGWKMYANSNVPASLAISHDAVGSDHDSTGLFQQRQAWGPLSSAMSPELSAGLFYDGGAAGQRGLTDFDFNSDSRSPGQWAQAVQVSEFPDRYQQHWDHANALYNRLTTTPTPPSQGDDFMSALSDAEQREMLGYLRWMAQPGTGELRKQYPSRSAVREPNEGLVDTAVGMELNTDGNVDFVATFLRAALKFPPAIERLKRVAQGVEPGRSELDSLLAQAMLADAPKLLATTVVAAVAPAAAGPAVVNSPAVTAVVDTRELTALHEENARLREELARLQATQYVPELAAAAVPPTEVKTQGQTIGQFIDAVSELNLSDASSIQERATLGAAIKVLSTKNGTDL